MQLADSWIISILKNVVFWDMMTACGSEHKIEVICSSEMSVLTRTTQLHHIPEDSIFHCYCRENVKSYIVVLCERLIITFDKATACQQYLQVNRHDSGDTIARSSLHHLSWGMSSLQTKGTQSLSPWRWRRYVSLKCQFLHEPRLVIISQKTAIFIVTTVKTSNLNKYTVRNSFEVWTDIKNVGLCANWNFTFISMLILFGCGFNSNCYFLFFFCGQLIDAIHYFG
jgi:hypothetical protein